MVEAHKVKSHKVVCETLEETMKIGFTERQREDSSLPSTITAAPLTAEQAEATFKPVPDSWTSLWARPVTRFLRRSWSSR